ncbi:nicotinamide riboside transporter PnuC [Paraferrimonas sedimenticola]|uniref:Nicotinamide riboside transporter PnuC n=1 Tax=Paraferrimonas sedimenticola TaxID=375674 RepID=A0AA37W0L2_9GAMM|nr:nicotinamide riboside transporter PnuC [Paraferrimonas sedimenticola]GLP96445.1 nicotinamide mononucleotide transporter [Paraferrimonas sedimenticola]
MDWFSGVIGDVQALSLWEGLAVVLSVLYLLGAMATKLWCWAAAFASTLIYTLLFWHVALLLESALNLYYMGMAVYGFWLWRFGPGPQGNDSGIGLTVWSLSTHLKLILGCAVFALVLGYVMDNYTHADLAYLDALTTSFAVMTTYLVAKKVVENWLYWVVIDLVSIYLYLQKGLMLTSALFVFYTVMAGYSYFLWRKKYQTQQAELANAVA